MTLLQQPLGALATSIPGATALFREHKLDFCCEGRRSLAEAAAARGLDAAALAARLESLQTGASPSGDWRGAGNAKLIDHLLDHGYQVWLTADHGNIQCTGLGRPAVKG